MKVLYWQWEWSSTHMRCTWRCYIGNGNDQVHIWGVHEGVILAMGMIKHTFEVYMKVLYWQWEWSSTHMTCTWRCYIGNGNDQVHIWGVHEGVILAMGMIKYTFEVYMKVLYCQWEWSSTHLRCTWRCYIGNGNDQVHIWRVHEGVILAVSKILIK
jgi:hypothetical protein